ncbi:hypothetical protein [Myxosarcina sp. GI1]|uniref:hypothetical protein n=1 Tax=Myxosarcina sp. GI1 TaxID=1541065 RepID=UPI0012DFF1DD|nr:hypothetical protein [Myxosarcina sp. GI1]
MRSLVRELLQANPEAERLWQSQLEREEASDILIKALSKIERSHQTKAFNS